MKVCYIKGCFGKYAKTLLSIIFYEFVIETIRGTIDGTSWLYYEEERMGDRVE